MRAKYGNGSNRGGGGGGNNGGNNAVQIPATPHGTYLPAEGDNEASGIVTQGMNLTGVEHKVLTGQGEGTASKQLADLDKKRKYLMEASDELTRASNNFAGLYYLEQTNEYWGGTFSQRSSENGEKG